MHRFNVVVAFCIIVLITIISVIIGYFLFKKDDIVNIFNDDKNNVIRHIVNEEMSATEDVINKDEKQKKQDKTDNKSLCKMQNSMCGETKITNDNKDIVVVVIENNVLEGEKVKKVSKQTTKKQVVKKKTNKVEKVKKKKNVKAKQKKDEKKIDIVVKKKTDTKKMPIKRKEKEQIIVKPKKRDKDEIIIQKKEEKNEVIIQKVQEPEIIENSIDVVQQPVNQEPSEVHNIIKIDITEDEDNDSDESLVNEEQEAIEEHETQIIKKAERKVR